MAQKTEVYYGQVLADNFKDVYKSALTSATVNTQAAITPAFNPTTFAPYILGALGLFALFTLTRGKS